MEVTVSWSEVPPIHQNGIILYFEVSYWNIMEGSYPETQNTTKLSVNMTDLCQSANYSVQVRAHTEVGPGPYSHQQFITTDHDHVTADSETGMIHHDTNRSLTAVLHRKRFSAHSRWNSELWDLESKFIK